MFKKWFVSIVVSGLFLISVHLSGVLAGVEPSPFQPEINQLGAVANILSSADFRVAKTMEYPPDPCTPPDPCKYLNGDVNRLEAINNQIGSADNMVFSMIDEVMGFEPTPFRQDLIPPLVVVGDVAGGIADNIDVFIRNSAGAYAPEFIEALELVSGSASRLVITVDDGIKWLETTECPNIVYEDICVGDPLCEWVTPAGAPAYCTAIGS